MRVLVWADLGLHAMNLLRKSRTNLMPLNSDHVCSRFSPESSRFGMSEQYPAARDPSQEDASGEPHDTSENKSAFSEHKGKLAIGVAATLGLIVFYKWRERRLAKEDPEAYARLQRLKASVRHREPGMAAEEGDTAAPLPPGHHERRQKLKAPTK